MFHRIANIDRLLRLLYSCWNHISTVIPTADTWFVDLRKENFRGMLTFRLHKRDLSFKHRPFVHHFHGALNYLATR